MLHKKEDHSHGLRLIFFFQGLNQDSELRDSIRGLLGDKIEWKKSQAKADHELRVERMRREQDRLDNKAQERLQRENNEVQARLARGDNDAQVRIRMQREKLLVNTRLKLLEMGKDPALGETLCPPVRDDF
jgi:DNA relaxase NicK